MYGMCRIDELMERLEAYERKVKDTYDHVLELSKRPDQEQAIKEAREHCKEVMKKYDDFVAEVEAFASTMLEKYPEI